ncbi:hypothetical protein [Polaribacter sp. Asnod6-C07]|uniref:hypothetical protein n=1 Tax=Polaribacter sp. Asnod6-C07 TaxID=3160582 RepID=UPI0038672A5A
MELSKEQIQIIDNHFKNNGIKYWDLRVEMIDHIVSDIEKNATSDDFKAELYKSLLKTKWLGDLSNLNRKGWQNVNRIYRKKYFQGFLDFFKKPFYVLLLIVILIAYYFLSEHISHKVFLKTSFAIFAAPLFVYFFFAFKTFRKKLGKSIHRDYALNYFMFSFLTLNAIVIFVRIEDGFPIEYHKIILFIVLPIHYIFTFSGYKVYKNAMNRVQEMKKAL